MKTLPKIANNFFISVVILSIFLILLPGCSSSSESRQVVTVSSLSPLEVKSAESIGLNLDTLCRLKEKRLYEFNTSQLDKYLGFLQKIEPDFRKRVMHLAKKNIGQTYEIYLLGEYPFENYDDQPLYCLDKSDCVVFSEHIYAMALTHNWKEFFAMLQRIRYKDGVIGYLTRNHYTELDWDNNNNWLINDITNIASKGNEVKTSSKIDKAAFFKKYNIGQSITPQSFEWSYIPAEKIKDALPELNSGDFVNVVRGFSPTSLYVGHVGLISKENDGTIDFIHSTEPQVKEQSLMSYVERALALNEKRKKENEEIVKWNKEIVAKNNEIRAKNGGVVSSEEQKLMAYKPLFYGLRFFRLQENAYDNLRKIDGPNAPKVTIYGN